MTIDFTQPVLFDAANTGYMVTMKELPQIGAPNYEVLEGYPNWPDVMAWIAAQTPGFVVPPYVPPAAIPPTPVQQAQATIAAIQASGNLDCDFAVKGLAITGWRRWSVDLPSRWQLSQRVIVFLACGYGRIRV